MLPIHNTRLPSKKGINKETDTESDMEEQEEQPTPEVEVTAGDTLENPPDRPAQTEETKLDNLMKIMMEWFDRMERNSKSLNTKIEETEKNNNNNMETLKEDLGKKIDEIIKTWKRSIRK